MQQETTQAGAKSIRVRGTARSRATAAAVFSLLKTSDTWPKWSIFNSTALERAGKDEPFGVGAIRSFSTRTSTSREEVTELIPDRKLSYILLSGLPLQNYRADVCLIPSGGETLVDWTATFQCSYGTGWFWRIFMNRILAMMATRLALAAEGADPRGTPRA